MQRAEFDAALAAGRAVAISTPPSHADAPQEDHKLLDATQLEAVTGVPATWWMAAARSRRVPFRKIGRRIRFVLAEVIACEDFKREKIDRHLTPQNFNGRLAKRASG